MFYSFFSLFFFSSYYWVLRILFLFWIMLVVSHLVVSDSLWLHGLYLLCPLDFPGKNPRVGSHSLLQGIFLTQRSNTCLLHCRWILYHLSHKGCPHVFWIWVFYEIWVLQKITSEYMVWLDSSSCLFWIAEVLDLLLLPFRRCHLGHFL